jgi:hypothetical protein
MCGQFRQIFFVRIVPRYFHGLRYRNLLTGVRSLGSEYESLVGGGGQTLAHGIKHCIEKLDEVGRGGAAPSLLVVDGALAPVHLLSLLHSALPHFALKNDHGVLSQQVRKQIHRFFEIYRIAVGFFSVISETSCFPVIPGCERVLDRVYANVAAKFEGTARARW